MRPIHLLTIVVVVTSSVATPASAQNPFGGLVRVSHDDACCGNPLTGTLVAATADSLWIRTKGAPSSTAPIALARRSVREFERGELVGAHILAGTGAGLFVGTVVGTLIGAGNQCQHCDGNGGFAVISGALAGGLVGILAGAVIGSQVPHYVWGREEVPRRVGLTVGHSGATQVGASLRF